MNIYDVSIINRTNSTNIKKDKTRKENENRDIQKSKNNFIHKKYNYGFSIYNGYYDDIINNYIVDDSNFDIIQTHFPNYNIYVLKNDKTFVYKNIIMTFIKNCYNKLKINGLLVIYLDKIDSQILASLKFITDNFNFKLISSWTIIKKS
jgi:hypothetical protein